MVHLSVLSGLIRATAINASRAQRAEIPCYKNYFEERNEALQNIFNQHKEMTSFEAFSSTIYLPKQQQFTGNSFFQNSILQQSSSSQNNNNESKSSTTVNKLHSSKSNNLQDNRPLFEPLIRKEHLERPKMLVHQHSEPLMRKNQRSQSVSQFKSTNADLVHLKHHPIEK